MLLMSLAFSVDDLAIGCIDDHFVVLEAAANALHEPVDVARVVRACRTDLQHGRACCIDIDGPKAWRAAQSDLRCNTFSGSDQTKVLRHWHVAGTGDQPGAAPSVGAGFTAFESHVIDFLRRVCRVLLNKTLCANYGQTARDAHRASLVDTKTSAVPGADDEVAGGGGSVAEDQNMVARDS
eukprot:TRINITY_DN4996_c0_g1_i1.p1 TRINITY_DN4996_c0_g1~~TRINITY_DN4996_c0_g1_i1.p1  ORF type:complete len:181 (+),score=9.58 TRINITY_DN4996_c0_g1_i1:294-836(+)